MDMRNLLKIVEENQQITEARRDLYFDVIQHFNGVGKDRRFAESLRTKAEAGVPISELVVLFNNFCLKKWGRKLSVADARDAVRNIVYPAIIYRENIDPNKLVSDPTELQTHDTHISAKKAYERILNGEKDENLIRAIAKDAMYSYQYALDVLKGPFPLGEPAIAKNTYHSYHYALNVLKEPFPLGEPAIAKDAAYSYYYARYVLKKKPFPLGEPAIAKDAYFSYWYARDVLEEPFPLGEPKIATDKFYSYRYAKYVLKGRPWTGLQQKSVELHDSFDIEIGEDLLIETGVVDFTDDGIVLEADDETLKLLSEHGVLLEEVDVVLESVRQKDPRIDFKSWEDPEKLKYFDEPTIDRVKSGATTIDTTPYETPPSMRDPDRGLTPAEKRRASLIRQGIIKADEVKESEMIDEPLNSAGQAIARRIVTVNHDLLIKYGLDKVLNAIRTISDDLNDLEEIGTSDVSAWVHSVERMLSSENNSDMGIGPKNLEDKPLSEVDKIDELSTEKLLAYQNAAELSRNDTNAKWDKKQATPIEKYKLMNREKGQLRAAEKVKKRTGSYNPGLLARIKSGIVDEEVDKIDEGKLDLPDLHDSEFDAYMQYVSDELLNHALNYEISKGDYRKIPPLRFKNNVKKTHQQLIKMYLNQKEKYYDNQDFDADKKWFAKWGPYGKYPQKPVNIDYPPKKQG